MKIKLILITCLVSLSTSVWADRIKPEDAVEYRQSAFRLMGAQLSVMNPLHRRQAYDDEQFAYRAQVLSQLSALALEHFTEESKGIKSRSHARVWEEKERFTQSMQEFEAITANLAETAASGNKRATRDAFRQTLQSCKACHDRYRLD
ncbi:c-type cytochrome [Nitrincola tapanii]|uniref:Cytochrome c n=1 Tax=Nitrincola tapanii TaxID=1708751 RepID=A0A5A9W1N6_9GAMM|nr:cytochrome c [Nitrincola tapanii]KAA0874647.1 cytochrome c [Nitrincola tapanii]